MVKTSIHTFQKMNKDLTESKNPVQFYYDAHNIRFITNQEVSTGGFSFEKGNSLVITIPRPIINPSTTSVDYTTKSILKKLTYLATNPTQPRNELEENYFISNNVYRTSGNQVILGHVIIRDNIILFTTDNNGFDCIWKVNDEDYSIELLYLRNLGFSTSNPIQAINNYENEIIDKIYWVDAKNQMRFVNVYHSTDNQDLENLIDLSFNNINMVGTFDLDQPEIIGINRGGIHTAGMIQYSYNLYKINGSQTKISPLTELIALNKGTNNGGGDINEIVGAVPVIKIDNLDNDYTNLRLYAIKYTSYNQLPSVSLILDRDITTINQITYYDDGNIIQSISLEEFLFLGSDVIIPKHINSKNNILFIANYKEKNFDINNYGELTSIDTRAYSFPNNSTNTVIYNSLEENNVGTIISSEPSYPINTAVIDGTIQVPYKHSAININYDIYNKQYNNSIIGGEGAYLKYRIVRNQVGINGFTQEDADNKFFKDNEIYRLAIQFYNVYGQNSLPKWIADFKNIVINNESNLNGYYSSIEITLKPLFYVWLNDQSNFLDEFGNYDETLKPVGYRLLRAERTLLDRSILCQGLLNGMLSQVNGDNTGDNDPNDPEQQERVHNGLKIPSMMRRFDEFLAPMWRNLSYDRLDRLNEFHPNWQNYGQNGDSRNEVYKAQESGQWSAGTYQFTKMIQMFSPDITFNTIQNLSQTKLNVIGGLENDYNAAWEQVRDISTKSVEHEAKVFTAIYPFDVKAQGANFNLITGERDNIQFHGFFGHGNENKMNFVQTYRRYIGDYIQSNIEEEIYGVPDIAETGQGRTTYNNDSDLIYANSLEPLAADVVLTNVNSWGARNATFALGANNIDTIQRKSLEQIFTNTGISDTGIGLIGEFRIPRNLIYLGNLYGGNTYESKKRSNYIEIGDYNDISNNIYLCINPGDTFVDNFRFTKLVKTTTEIYSRSSEQLTEIVEFRVETTVDIKNRNDQSITDWDNRFQPVYDEYQKYNTVYSQESNLIIRRDTDYKFKKVEGFDTNVISTKTKIPGEIIDSWTDLQPNNILTLDGKHGPINNLVSFRDELYTYQDKGIAVLSILPRVQVTGDDGIEVELGSGKVLQEYKYLTQTSGSINKWGIISTEVGMFYIDALNKSFNQIGESFVGISDMEGFHKYFLDNIEVSNIKIDNPILYNGCSLGWDKVTNDIYISVFNEGVNFTLSYNLAQKGFSSFYDYHSSMYIFTKGKMLTINPNANLNNTIYENFTGNYNTFYNINKLSSIDFIVNPEPNIECTFNNLEYKSEALDTIDTEIQNYTWERIRAYNEFQNSGLINLALRSNIRKLNRKWRLNIPRDINKTNRIRNTWSILHLESNNVSGFNYRNHDIIVYYNPNYKMIS